MSRWSHPVAPALLTLVVFAGCNDSARRVDGSLGVVEVIETPAPIALAVPAAEVPTPLVLPQPQPYLEPVPPQAFYLEPLPAPVRHGLRVWLAPVGARALDEVQSIEVELEIEGGRRGARPVSVVFVSPQGLVWERQEAEIETQPGERATAHFSLPVAATFVEEQQLFGAWQLRSLDEGVEQADATVQLEGVTP